MSEDVPPRDPLIVLAGLRIIRVLGRGGAGVVYLARQESMNRDVALKVLDAVGRALSTWWFDSSGKHGSRAD